MNAYEGLAEGEQHEDGHWAFGTGFLDTLSEVDRAIPSGVDPEELAQYCLMLGDDALVLAQRLAEWTARAPELEEDVALANIALDLLGQARALLARAGDCLGRTEDELAYLRDATGFRTVRLVEVDCGPGPGGDFAVTIARLLVFSSWRLAVLQRLADSRDPVLAAVAAKGVRELAYHRDHAAQWVLRLAGGTALSREKMVNGLDVVWPYVGELFTTHPVEESLAAQGIAVDPAGVRAEVESVFATVFTASGLTAPAVAPLAGTSRDGDHTPALAPLLAEMQEVHRALPGAVW